LEQELFDKSNRYSSCKSSRSSLDYYSFVIWQHFRVHYQLYVMAEFASSGTNLVVELMVIFITIFGERLVVVGGYFICEYLLAMHRLLRLGRNVMDF